jgi:hypothetical protein
LAFFHGFLEKIAIFCMSVKEEAQHGVTDQDQEGGQERRLESDL